MIVANLYAEGLIPGHRVFIEAIFRVYGSKERRGVGWSRGG